MAKKVYIGVGHGGTDSGAVANGLKEKDLNLVTALACKDELIRHGVSVKISREKDISVYLADRIKQAKDFKADLAVDIHYNAGKGDGAEVFHSKAKTTDDKLAKNILDEIVKVGQNSRGIKTKISSNGKDYFGFVRQLTVDYNIPAVLVECAFIDNKTDIKIADTAAEQKAMGIAIAKGILNTLGIAYKSAESTTSTTLYKVQIGAYSKKENAEAQLKKVKAAGFKDAVIVTEKK